MQNVGFLMTGLILSSNRIFCIYFADDCPLQWFLNAISLRIFMLETLDEKKFICIVYVQIEMLSKGIHIYYAL